MKYSLNKTLVYLLVFTIISSSLAYYLVLQAYETYSPDVYFVE